MFIRVAWSLMVAGVLLLVTASVVPSRVRTSMAGTAIVPATVIDRQMVLTNGINRNRPVVSFITVADKNVTFISMSTLRLEDDLHVIYRIDNPDDARIYLGVGEYLVAFVLAIIGIACGGIGGGLLKILQEETRPATSGATRPGRG